jgi:hypothetical protein
MCVCNCAGGFFKEPMPAGGFFWIRCQCFLVAPPAHHCIYLINYINFIINLFNNSESKKKKIEKIIK